MNASPSVASNGQTANGLTTRQHPVHRNTAIGQGAIWDHRHETEHPRRVHSPLRQGDGLAQMRRLIFALTVATIVMPAFAEPIDPADIWIIDGDTVRIHHQHPNVRLVGFNAPETYRAVCQAEADLGARATRRLRELVKLGNLDFAYVRCSCPEGTQGTVTCNWGRSCGSLRANGRDVGAILIEEGLAAPFVCGTTSCPPTPRPWCDRQ
jgi:endonuclease YncB( thermonuclease family)